jgi:dephospho-CoA kinase
VGISPEALVIGLTGPFGSGATTCAQILSDRLQFSAVKLSVGIRAEFKKRNDEVQPTRAQLQELGDELRESNDASVLAS